MNEVIIGATSKFDLVTVNDKPKKMLRSFNFAMAFISLS